jgi:hypothetical protein
MQSKSSVLDGQRRRTGRRWAGWLIPFVLLLAACQPVQPVAPAAQAADSETGGEIPAITITAQDFAFDMPDELPAGWVSLTLVNDGEVNHHALFARLNEGTTLDDVKEALAGEAGESEGPDSRFDESNQFFMPDTDPGQSNQATVELAAGTWVIFSVSIADMTGQDLRADWEQGSIRTFEVVDSGASAAPPAADVVLTIGNDDADMPAELSAGTHTIRIVNGGDAEGASAFFIKLEDGATVEDILASFEAFFSGAEVNFEEMPTFRAVGGLMGYNLGDSYYTTIEFEPGDYAAITSINGGDFPYAGLSKSFTVK